MEFTRTITIEDLICFAGLTLFACWLLKTSLGRRALADSVPRRNNMPLYTPFIPLFIWFGAVPMATAIAKALAGDLRDWQTAFMDNIVICVWAVITTAVMLFLARTHFARRLKGFGLNIRTIHKDFATAVVNLLVVWPLIIATIAVTVFLGELIRGQEYQMQQHQQLELITEHARLPLHVLIAFGAVVTGPVLEELMFRGFIQTTIRSFFKVGNGAWIAIAISSALFAMMHEHPGHWPALFVLGVCMGYAYEKSGSLLRPIFIHSLFNATRVIAVLNQ
ncbi:MAG: lysostaphin resistance A-like protein [Planctomycetota bacterium]|jgi:membrane protease YdiL (CAAX protease family)